MNDANRPDDTDNDLRRLFAETAAGIRPLGTLDDIRTRTEKVDPMTRRWFLPSMAAAAVMALVIGGAFWITQDKDDPATGPADSPTAAVERERAAPAYFVGQAAQGPRLFREFQTAHTCPTAECLATSSAYIALTGPEDRDYSSPWPANKEGGVMEDEEVEPHYGRTTVTYNDDVLTITLYGTSLAERPAGMTAAEAELAVQQLIYSAQAGLGKGRVPVQLLINEKHTPSILGVPASEPLAAAEELDVLAPVQISDPRDGQNFPPGDVKVTGVAAAYEANVTWELLVGGDAEVANGFATAEECCKFSPYEFVLEDLEPGTYTLVVHDNDESGEGRPVNRDTREIVVE